MIEIVGDIWEQKCDWLCITTNGIIDKRGSAVMGKGIALQAKQRFSGIEKILAKKIQEKGNIVSSLFYDIADQKWIISFPTKNDWRDKSDINLIENSAEQLKQHFDKYCSTHKNKPIVMLPRPGCSNGQLDWKDVKKVIEPILTDDRFILITI